MTKFLLIIEYVIVYDNFRLHCSFTHGDTMVMDSWAMEIHICKQSQLKYRSLLQYSSRKYDLLFLNEEVFHGTLIGVSLCGVC